MPAYTAAKDSVCEFYEKKSRFIGRVFFVSSEEEAEARIGEIKNLYPDATHNCWAYNLRKFSARRVFDDGEPQGTAGLPILSVIDANNLSDVCVVVTRYFGGILLGAGGLVRAYSRAAAEAVKAAGVSEIVPFAVFSLTFGYSRLNRVKTVLSKFPADILKEEYGEMVYMEISLPKDDFENLKNILRKFYYDMAFPVLSEFEGRRRVDRSVKDEE